MINKKPTGLLNGHLSNRNSTLTWFLSKRLIFIYPQAHHEMNSNQQWPREAALKFLYTLANIIHNLDFNLRPNFKGSWNFISPWGGESWNFKFPISEPYRYYIQNLVQIGPVVLEKILTDDRWHMEDGDGHRPIAKGHLWPKNLCNFYCV